MSNKTVAIIGHNQAGKTCRIQHIHRLHKTKRVRRQPVNELKEKECTRCGGSGSILSGNMKRHIPTECPDCEGTGRIK